MANRISETLAEFKTLRDTDVVAIWNTYCEENKWYDWCVSDTPGLTEEERVAGRYSKQVSMYEYCWTDPYDDEMFFDHWDGYGSPIKVTEDFADWYFDVYLKEY